MIVHGPDNEVRVTGPCSTLEYAYHAGYLPPNYPVPAISMRCDIWPDRVIWSVPFRTQRFGNGFLSKTIK